MNEETWGFYVPIDEEYKMNRELIEINNNNDDSLHRIRTSATFYESVCGYWRLFCLIVFRNR